MKRRFRGDLGETYSIPVPGLVNDSVQGVHRGKFSLNGTQVAQIFKPVLDEIIALVKGQSTFLSFWLSVGDPQAVSRGVFYLGVLLIINVCSLQEVKSRAMLESPYHLWPNMLWWQLLPEFSPDMPFHVTYLLVMTMLTPKSLTVSSTKRTVKAVLLVGGFGESPYLRESLRSAVGSGIEVLVPTNRWA